MEESESQGHAGLHGEFGDSQSYVRAFKQTNKQTNEQVK